MIKTRPGLRPGSWQAAAGPSGTAEKSFLDGTVRVLQSEDIATVTQRWRTRTDWVILLTGVLFSLLCAGLVTFIIRSGDYPLNPVSIFFLANVVIASATSLGVAYWGLARCLGQTAIRASRKGLTIEHGPLPLPECGTELLPGVTRVACEPYEVALAGRYWVIRETQYRLMAHTWDRREVPLLAGFTEREPGEKLARVLETGLGLRD